MAQAQNTRSFIRIPRFVRAIFALILREMSTTYGKSSMGYVWAILEPIGAIAVLTLAFSLAFRSPALGESFALFYATGYMPFMLYNTVQGRVSISLRENKRLLFYPRVTYIDVIAARFLLIMITQLLVCMIVYSGIIIMDNVTGRIDLRDVMTALVLSGFLGLGIGVLNAVIIHLLPSWQAIWSILNRPIFLISCIFFLFDSIPLWAQDILWWNPLIHLIGENRIGFYGTYRGDYVTLAYPALVGALSLFFGLLLLRRHEQDLINS